MLILFYGLSGWQIVGFNSQHFYFYQNYVYFFIELAIKKCSTPQ